MYGFSFLHHIISRGSADVEEQSSLNTYLLVSSLGKKVESMHCISVFLNIWADIRYHSRIEGASS